MALLHLIKRCFAKDEVEVLSATVNHGLRPEASGEAQFVAAFAKSLGIGHKTLNWTGWDGSGNLQDNARRARYRLLNEWANQNGIDMIAVGHTADDQAENFIMRLARSSGIDGLSGMLTERPAGEVTLVRPLLGVTRRRLRNYLDDNGVRWIEDPSNDDPRFDRVRVRKAMKELEPLGITTETLSDVSGNLSRVRDAINWATSTLR